MFDEPAGGLTTWLQRPDARLYVRVVGDGPPLVLLHGWAMDHRVFRPQLAGLAGHFRLVTYDRRGFGRSAGRPDLDRELDDLEAVARELIDASDADPSGRFHLLGLSQGGRIALRYAVRRPQRLRSLILQGAGLDGAEPEERPDERIPLEAFAALARSGRLDELRTRWLRHPMLQLGAAHPQAERLLRDMLDDYHGADLLNGAAAAGHTAAEILPALAAAALPVLLLTGARETASRRRAAAILLEALPRAREQRLPNSGHLSNLSEPEAYNAAVIGFCRALDGMLC